MTQRKDVPPQEGRLDLTALIRQQGIKSPQRWEDLFGSGKELWADDQEFESFLWRIEARRHEGVRQWAFSCWTRMSCRIS